MASNRDTNPVKLFVSILSPEGVPIRRVEKRLVAEFGAVDHRSSVMPPEGSIHRCLLSFERLIDPGSMPEICRQAKRIDEELATTTDAGKLENSKVTLAVADSPLESTDLLHFNNGAAQFLPWAHPDFQSKTSQEFFLKVRQLYRDQLRSMCLLRR